LLEIDYSETDQRLAVRIRAHTEFANFQLEDWLKDRLFVSDGGRILEAGCGNGNFFPVYAAKLGPNGTIVGFDVSDSLLEAAQKRGAACGTPTVILKWDFNDPMPFLNDDFDSVTCLYAAYYAKDAGRWCDEILRVAKPGGQLLLMGPAADNAAELYELNEAISGTAHVEGTDYTTRRLQDEFLPTLQERLGSAVKFEVLDRRIEFPTARDFAEYYHATWLYEKTAEKVGREFSVEEVEGKVKTRTLSKRVVVIEATV